MAVARRPIIRRRIRDRKKDTSIRSCFGKARNPGVYPPLPSRPVAIEGINISDCIACLCVRLPRMGHVYPILFQSPAQGSFKASGPVAAELPSPSGQGQRLHSSPQSGVVPGAGFEPAIQGWGPRELPSTLPRQIKTACCKAGSSADLLPWRRFSS